MHPCLRRLHAPPTAGLQPPKHPCRHRLQPPKQSETIKTFTIGYSDPPSLHSVQAGRYALGGSFDGTPRMFSRLLGKPKEQTSALATIEKLYETLEMLEKKEKVLLKKSDVEIEKAKQFTKTKNKRVEWVASVSGVNVRGSHKGSTPMMGNGDTGDWAKTTPKDVMKSQEREKKKTMVALTWTMAYCPTAGSGEGAVAWLSRRWRSTMKRSRREESDWEDRNSVGGGSEA
ncbi:hypothetical protein ZIOFF_029145 [Zingiber officinale]|uniref:Uncharacterized protein n=1 Tax=Zingiber officinale TaxID=94328 RepID=A0A8J5LE92_ZINOF|nr:hypothetical protein ZIOFF_029145 [Zingiber officinale]